MARLSSAVFGIAWAPCPWPHSTGHLTTTFIPLTSHRGREAHLSSVMQSHKDGSIGMSGRSSDWRYTREEEGPYFGQATGVPMGLGPGSRTKATRCDSLLLAV